MPRLIIAPIAAVLAVAGCASTTERSDTGAAASPASAGAPAPTVAVTSEPPVTTKPTRTHAAAPTRTAASTRPATTGGCPVSADTLTAVAVPGYSATDIDVVPSSIRCAKGWAQADPGIEGGDGVLLYHYDAGSGAWKFRSEGSSIDCGELGIPRAAGRKLSVCYYP